MSVLTWRNVNGPDTSGITDSMRLSREAMLAGIGNFNKIPQAVFDARTAMAERDASVALNAAANPADFDSLVPSVTSNPNISQAFINNLAARRTALQGRNEADIKYNDVMRNATTAETDRQTLENNPQIMQSIIQGQIDGNRGRVSEILNSPEGQLLSAAKRQELLTSGFTKADSTLTHNQQQTAYKDAQDAKAGDD